MVLDPRLEGEICSLLCDVEFSDGILASSGDTAPGVTGGSLRVFWSLRSTGGEHCSRSFWSSGGAADFPELWESFSAGKLRLRVILRFGLAVGCLSRARL